MQLTNTLFEKKIKNFVYGSQNYGVNNNEVYEYYKDFCLDRIYKRLQYLCIQPDGLVPPALLNKIVHNLCLDCRKSKGFKITFLLTERNFDTFNFYSEEDESNKEMIALLLQCMDLLKDKYKCLLQMHYLQGYSHMEIAETLELKPSSIGQSIYRAKSKLRSLVNNHIKLVA